MTITIQIGNTDDKLTQAEWAQYVWDVAVAIQEHAQETHFFACSAGSERWQNAAWVVVANIAGLSALKNSILPKLRAKYRQDSVAWTEGETQFV